MLPQEEVREKTETDRQTRRRSADCILYGTKLKPLRLGSYSRRKLTMGDGHANTNILKIHIEKSLHVGRSIVLRGGPKGGRSVARLFQLDNFGR